MLPEEDAAGVKLPAPAAKISSRWAEGPVETDAAPAGDERSSVAPPSRLGEFVRTNPTRKPATACCASGRCLMSQNSREAALSLSSLVTWSAWNAVSRGTAVHPAAMTPRYAATQRGWLSARIASRDPGPPPFSVTHRAMDSDICRSSAYV